MLDFLLGLFGSGIDAISSRRQQERQNAFNAEQAQLNRDFTSQEALKQRNWSTSEREATQAWNLEQWNRENEYNSPSSQLDRLLAAGINPNSAFQSMSNVSPGSVRSSAGTGASASGATASSAGLFNTNFGQAFQRYNESRLIDSQIEKTDAETAGLGIDNSNKQRAYDDAHEESVKQRDNLDKLSRKYGLEADLTDINLSLTQKELQFQTDAYKTKLDQLEQELKNAQDTGIYIKEQIETEQAKQDNLAADTANKKADTALKQAQRKFQEFQNDLFHTTGIRPSDGMTAVFAKVLQLRLEGKNDDAKKLETEYLDLVEKYRDKSQFSTVDKLASDVLQPVVPQLKQGVAQGANYLFGTPTDSIRNPTWFKKSGKPRYWPTPFGLMPSPY